MTAPFGLTPAQVEQLVKPINPVRVLSAQGHSHVAAFDVIAHLTRVFGFGGWSFEIVSLDCVYEHHEPPKANDKGRGRWWVTYRCVGRLVIRNLAGQEIARFEDAATGSSQNQPTAGDAHDQAVKNARSYAIKRCAKDLGDQFGLSLYNKGSVRPLIGATLTYTPDDGDVERHAQAPQTIGNDEIDRPDEGTVERTTGQQDTEWSTPETGTGASGGEAAAPVPTDDPAVRAAGSEDGGAEAGQHPAPPSLTGLASDRHPLPPTDAQMRALNAIARAVGASNAEDRNLLVSHLVGYDITSLRQLGKHDATRVIDALKRLEDDPAAAAETWAAIAEGIAIYNRAKEATA